MIEFKDTRTLELGQQVEVYRNLNKGRTFSIRDKKTGLVVAWGNKFKIENVTCKVSETGRQRVIEKKRKEVHAVLLGVFTGGCEFDLDDCQELFYDPYTLDSFVNKDTGKKINHIDVAYFEDGRCYILKDE